jgi:hypothetical protein
MYPSKTDGANCIAERQAEIPGLLSRQREQLEEQQVLMERLNSKLEPVMSPAGLSKTGTDPSMPVSTGFGNLIDRANQDIAATNFRLREMLERLAI